MRLRPRGPIERLTTTIANANAGWTPQQLIIELEHCLPALRAKHAAHLSPGWHEAPDLSALAADLTLCLVFPDIRRAFVNPRELT